MIGFGRLLILLGVLVFVHEIGHFLAAKLCNVYVVRLSLGFGRRLFGFKKGETDYCISAIPLGGYVKMVGQEDMPRSSEEAEQAEPDLPDIPPERRFDTQPTRNKLAISLAGPLMNLLFAIPVLWVVFMVGIHVPIFSQHTRIGAVTEGSPAEQAGIKPGQRVVSINGVSVGKWEEVQLKIWTSEDKPLDMELEDLSGEITHTTVTPTRPVDSTRATIGIEPFITVAIRSIVPGMPAERSGLKPGDIILTYNHQRPDNESMSMSKLIGKVNESAGKPLMLTVLRDGRTFDATVVPEKVNVIKGVEFDNNVVAYVESDEAGSAASLLKPEDVVTAVNGELLKKEDTADSLARRIFNYGGYTVGLTVERDVGFFREPQRLNVTAPLSQKGMIGVAFSPMVTEKFGPGMAFVKGLGAFGDSFALVMKTIYYLVSGRVSTREMAGPIGIGVLTEQTLKLGIGYYLNFVAFITINLAILNLLPIPMLDGGLILIALIESVRRKPLDEKYLIWAQKVGLAFILLLVLVATYNDILRAIKYFLGGEFIE
jgi:regulator of sigma E protease